MRIDVPIVVFLIILTSPVFGQELGNADIKTVVIQAEDFREGGEGVAYHDTSAANNGNAGIRENEGVDIYIDDNGIVRIGNMNAGEWLTYDWTCEKTGIYKFTFYVGTTQDGATANILLNDVLTSAIQIPNTGDYTTFATIGFIKQIEAGQYIIKIYINDEHFDIDRFEISYAFEAKIYEHLTYFITTDKKILVQWDTCGDTIDYYEVVLKLVETGEMIDAGKTKETNLIVTLPKSGHYVVMVRACIDDGAECSAWTESTKKENSLVNGVNRDWWVYGHVAPPGEIIIK